MSDWRLPPNEKLREMRNLIKQERAFDYPYAHYEMRCFGEKPQPPTQEDEPMKDYSRAIIQAALGFNVALPVIILNSVTWALRVPVWVEIASILLSAGYVYMVIVGFCRLDKWLSKRAKG